MGVKANQLIVVIESGPEDLSILVEGLQATGAKNPIKHFGSGKGALDYFFNRGVGSEARSLPTPALIFLDLHLSDMDGRRFLSLIRHTSSLKTIPLVVFSPSPTQQEANECYELGANSCMQKPDTPADCVSILSCLMDYWSEVIVAPQVDMSGSKRRILQKVEK